MSHQASQSQVGDRKAYQKDEKTQYSAAEVQGVYEATGVNVAAYQDPSKPINEMLKEENERRLEEQKQKDPTYAASKHGNEPSRGAKVDAELKEEEEAILAKKKGKTDSIPGKQMPPHTGKTAQKQELDEAAHEERKAHSKSGANTGQQGMETIPRKN